MSLCSNKRELEIVRGTTNAFGIELKDESGAEYTLEAGQSLVFGLKMNENDDERILIKKISNTVNGEHYLELTPADTADLPIGRYYYDVGLQHGDNIFYSVIESSPFTIKPNITRLGDGA